MTCSRRKFFLAKSFGVPLGSLSSAAFVEREALLAAQRGLRLLGGGAKAVKGLNEVSHRNF